MTKPTKVYTIYRFGNDKVEELPYFLYEVTLYEISKNTARLLKSTYYKSDKLLITKKEICKKVKNKLIVKSINLLGVPFSFIKENNLKKYQLIKNNKK